MTFNVMYSKCLSKVEVFKCVRYHTALQCNNTVQTLQPVQCAKATVWQRDKVPLLIKKLLKKIIKTSKNNFFKQWTNCFDNYQTYNLLNCRCTQTWIVLFKEIPLWWIVVTLARNLNRILLLRKRTLYHIDYKKEFLHYYLLLRSWICVFDMI